MHKQVTIEHFLARETWNPIPRKGAGIQYNTSLCGFYLHTRVCVC